MKLTYASKGFAPAWTKQGSWMNPQSQQAQQAPQPTAQSNPYQANWVNKVKDPDMDYAPFMVQNDLLKYYGDQAREAYDLQESNNIFRRRALNALSPGGIQGSIDRFGAMAGRNADTQGRENSFLLRGLQGGEEAAMLGAQNQAARDTNAFAGQQMGMSGELQAAMQGMGITDINQVMSSLPLMLALNEAMLSKAGQVDSSRASQRGGGFGGVIGSLLGSVGPIGSLFK